MAARITLYTFPPSQNAVRPELALLEKGLAFEKVSVDLFGGEAGRQPLSELTPRAQVPTLVYEDGDDELVIYESIAIIRFIDDVYPDGALMPPVSEPRRRAEALMRIEEFQAKLDPRNIFGSVVFGRQGREQLGEGVDSLLAELQRWDAYTQGRTFLAGDPFTLADIAVFPLLMHFEALGYDFPLNTPSLAGYIDRCKDRPSVQTSGWVECFYEFVRERDPEQVLAGAAR